jgi:sterol desaturase/sphingolipid hydroxylase (fatty acid hydroxylase superfamily)
LAPVYAGIAVLCAFVFTEPVWPWFVAIAVGVVLWTLTEYFMHRYLFHGWPYQQEHALHHIRPTEWIGVSAFIMGPLFLVVWVLMVYALGDLGRAGMLFAGYVTGYWGYVVIHLMIHHTNWSIVSNLRATHEMHHRGAGGNYGVSSNIWDHLFGTYLKPI